MSESLAILVVDDKVHHLEKMIEFFGKKVVAVHLDTREEPINVPAESAELLQEALKLPLDSQLDFTKRTYQTL